MKVYLENPLKLKHVSCHPGGHEESALRQWPAGAAGGAGAPPPPPGQRPAGQESTPMEVFHENNAWILRIPSWFLDFFHEFATQFRQNSKCCNKSGCFRLIATSRIDPFPTHMALKQKFLEVGEMIHPELSGLCKVWNPVLLVWVHRRFPGRIPGLPRWTDGNLDDRWKLPIRNPQESEIRKWGT